MNKKWNGRNIFHKCVLVLLVIALGDFLFTGRSSSDGGGGSSLLVEGSAGRESGRKRAECMASFLCFADRSSTQAAGFSICWDSRSHCLPMREARRMVGCRRRAEAPMNGSFCWRERVNIRKARTGMRWRCRETSEGRIQLDDKNDAAAPGGKSTYILSQLDDTGLLVSNEINPIRINALGENLEEIWS